MRVLLTCRDGPLDAARIAGEAGFAKRNISEVLTSLTNAGVIRAAWAGNERHFTAHRERWALFLALAGPADLPTFLPWVHLLPAALEISMWLDAKTDTAESEYLIASQARSLINRLTRDLEAAGIDIRHPQAAHGAAYLPIFAKASDALLARLRAAQ
jgi:DNA-binding transcriptional regulator GbsR (MarR family)